MSDVPTKEPAPAAKGTSPLRLIVLLSIFGIALAGLLYDYCVARPASKAAYDKVITMLEDEERTELSISPEDVQKEIGQKPSAVEDLENGKIEIYSWRSGMPIRKYSLYVVYSGRTLPLLYSASQNTRPDKLPPKNTPAIEMSEEELAKERMPIGAGAPGGGGRGGRGGRPGARGEDAKVSDDSEKGGEADKDDADKAEEPKKDDATKDDADKGEEPKKDEPKQDEPKQDEPKQDEPKQDEPKQDEPKQDEPKKDEPKKDDGS
jgi:hypothetical protein